MHCSFSGMSRNKLLSCLMQHNSFVPHCDLYADWTCLLREVLKANSLRPLNAVNSYYPSWHPTPVLLPGKSHGQRILVGYSPWGHTQSDTTERLQFHFSLSCIGEGNGNPLQCSFLENPRGGEAWWAAIYGVTQSRTQLKRLSSSSIPQTQCDLQNWPWASCQIFSSISISVNINY